MLSPVVAWAATMPLHFPNIAARISMPAVSMVVKSEDLTGEDLYIIIGVEPNCSPAELRRAFRKKALKLHPDVRRTDDAAAADDDDDAAFQFRRLVAAYDILADPSRDAHAHTASGFRSSPHAYQYHPPSAQPPSSTGFNLYDVYDAKWVRTVMVGGFILGQYVSWYLFLVSLQQQQHGATAGGAGPMDAVATACSAASGLC